MLPPAPQPTHDTSRIDDTCIAAVRPLAADQVSDAWLAFARSGDPNTGGLPRWPAFDAQRRATMVFDATSAAADHPLREQRIAMFAAKGLAG